MCMCVCMFVIHIRHIIIHKCHIIAYTLSGAAPVCMCVCMFVIHKCHIIIHKCHIIIHKCHIIVHKMSHHTTPSKETLPVYVSHAVPAKETYIHVTRSYTNVTSPYTSGTTSPCCAKTSEGWRGREGVCARACVRERRRGVEGRAGGRERGSGEAGGGE